ncbi:MAG TPA: sigma-70 family RNA polymerase sigma factor [Trebonia sp.]
MREHDVLAERFEEQRGQLRSMAYRLLGSAAEAEDAVQEAWFRLARADPDEVDNLAAWLRTVVTRICLDMLRSRRSRREDLAGDVGDVTAERPPAAGHPPAAGRPPEEEAVLADSVSRALLVVLDTLTPAERIAFVLHEMFAVPFGEIGRIVDRTPEAAKKLASRARQKVRGSAAAPAADLVRHRRVVSAFLAAARAGDVDGVLAVLAPDVVRRVDAAALPPGVPAEVRGARGVAEGTAAFAARSALAELALVNGDVGAVLAPRGRLTIALTFTFEGERITSYDVIADPARLRELDLAVLATDPPEA